MKPALVWLVGFAGPEVIFGFGGGGGTIVHENAADRSRSLPSRRP